MTPHKERYHNRIELLQGTLDLLILTTLQWRPQHGYGISLAIQTHSGDVLQVETGSLYPALHRLEKKGWIESDWRQTESNQRAKFYQLTAAGREQVSAGQTRWQTLVQAMAGVMNPAHAMGDVES